jgi:rubredoxin
VLAGGQNAALPIRRNKRCKMAAFATLLALQSLGMGAATRYHHGSRFHGFSTRTRMEYRSWMCLICGWIYDEEAGLPEEGIAPGTRWEDVPINWTCPECGARKEDFEMVQI